MTSSDYEPVLIQHSEDDDNEDDEDNGRITNDPLYNTSGSSHGGDDDTDSNSMMRIRIDDSNDSDEKTEPTSNLHHHSHSIIRAAAKESESGHLSFDLDDDDEHDLERYRLSSTTSSSSTGNNNHHHTSLSLSQHQTSPLHSTQTGGGGISTSVSSLWKSYCEVRIQHKRQRAEQMLVMNEDSIVDRCMVCLSTWTDVFDFRGLLLHIVLLIVWLIGCASSHQHRKTTVIVVGLLLWMIRILWRPIYWCAFGKRRERRRQATMAMYDNLNVRSSSNVIWNTSSPDDNDDEEEDDDDHLHDMVV